MDNSLFDPAPSNDTISYTPIEHYSILSLNNSNPSKPVATLSPISKAVIPKPGQLVSFLNNTCTFYIEFITPYIKAMYISGDTTLLREGNLGIIKSIYKPDSVDYKIVDSKVKLGSLKVKVTTPVHHKQGYLGWTMYLYDKVVLVGNDLNSKNYIQFYSSSVWEPGAYRLVIGVYDQYTKGLLNIADKEFEITAPLATIEVGTPYSIHKPINL